MWLVDKGFLCKDKPHQEIDEMRCARYLSSIMSETQMWLDFSHASSSPTSAAAAISAAVQIMLHHSTVSTNSDFSWNCTQSVHTNYCITYFYKVPQIYIQK